jgi:hypothetical protein
MSEPALKDDVIEALRAATGVSVTELADGSYEIAAVGQPLRRYPFKSTVSRSLLWRFVGWYKIPIEAFFKSYRVHPKSDAAGE